MRKIFIAVFLPATAFLVHAQTADTAIPGAVSDAGGGRIAGTVVTISQAATVSVKATRFRSARRSGVTIQIGQQAKIEDATLAGVVSQERSENLPPNGRNFDDLAILTHGVVVRNTDLHSSSTAGGTIASNRGRSIWGQLNVDGITMVNNRHNYVNLYPSVDAIQEFKVQTGKYAAEYGGNAGTNVNIQIQSGRFQMPFGEHHTLAFRAEGFNAFDTPQYSNPDGRYGNSTFGQATSTKIDKRVMQLALKYQF